MVKLAKQHPKLQFIGVVTDRPTELAKIKVFRDRFKISYQIAHLTNDLLMLLPTRSVPQVIVYDRRGRLVGNIIGWTEATQAELTKLLKAAEK